MKCLCCGKELNTSGNGSWHTHCIRTFFGMDELPKIDLTNDALEELVKETVSKGFTVAGVQKKISLHLSKESHGRLTIVDYPAGYILKPQAPGYGQLPEFEHLTMQMAELCRIKTVPHGLIHVGSDYAYITKRIDRSVLGNSTDKYAMEDFCQLSESQTIDKYRGSYEKCFKLIDRYSHRSGFDKTELFMRLVFCFVTGNSDMHLKNFSLIEDTPGSRIYSLSAAYDLLPVNVILPEDTEETALTLHGRKRRLNASDFYALAANAGIPDKAAVKMINKICSYEDQFLTMCRQSELSEDNKNAFSELITERSERLTAYQPSGY